MFRQYSTIWQDRRPTLLLTVACLTVLISGCSRRFWRQQAERDTYEAVSSKLNDPHWSVPRIDLQPDSRSRFHDPYDPDCEPLPPDDPAAHQSMHCVSGRKGYKNWHKLGQALSIENPHWLSSYGVLMENADPVHGHNQVQLEDVTLQQAIELTMIHSRDYQTSIEDLYLTALAVTQEQFNLGVRYFGPGVRVPGATASITDNPGGPDTVGLSPRFGVAQLLPAGTQLAVELANNTLWLFGGGTSSSASTLAFSLTQPLLFRAGRKVVLEALTQAERNVLYSARDLARFRQTLFTTVASDFLQIQRQLQAIRNLEGNILRLEEQLKRQREADGITPGTIRQELDVFPEDAIIPESIRDQLSYDNFPPTLVWRGKTMSDEQRDAILSVSGNRAYQSAAKQLIEFRTGGTISLSAAQLASRLNTQRNRLQDSQRTLADLTDRFKITLGLPPNVGMTLDDSLLQRFTLIDSDLYELDDAVKDLMERRGPLMIVDDIENVDTKELLTQTRAFLTELSEIRVRLAEKVKQVQKEFEPVEQLLQADSSNTRPGEVKRYFLNEDEKTRVQTDYSQDRRQFELTTQKYEQESQLLDMLEDELANSDFPVYLDTDGNGRISNEELPEDWLDIRKPGVDADEGLTYDEIAMEARDGLLRMRERIDPLIKSLQFFQANLRVEQVALNPFRLPGGTDFPDIDEVVEVGLNRRHDLMNARAAVMDARRIVEVAASELEATLDITMTGGLGTTPASRKPFDFSGTAASYSAGLALDTPADKMFERNAYNAALIDYQRARRDYMAVEDQIKQEIRVSWRQLKVSEQQLEIDRQALRVAALQFDIAAQPANLKDENSALNLLTALDSVLDAQNSLLRDWITWELSRLNIYRDMGIMQIDERGLWVDPFYVESISGPSVEPVPDSSSLRSPSPVLSATDSLPDVALPVLEFDTAIGDPE